MARIELRRGDIIYVDLRGAEGGEKQEIRPCVVIQNDKGNQFSPLTIIVPITDRRQDKNLPIQVPVAAAELGTWAKDSVIECGHIRSIDRDVRVLEVVGRISDDVMARVDRALKISLHL